MLTLAALSSRIGTWNGTNGFRLMPSDPVSEAPATAEVAQGTYDDGERLVVGYEYAAGWRWNIIVNATDADALRIEMDNVVPAEAAGEPTDLVYGAMSMNLRPGSG